MTRSTMKKLFMLLTLLVCGAVGSNRPLYVVNLPEDFGAVAGRETLDKIATAIYKPFFPVRTVIYPTNRAFKLMDEGDLVDADFVRMQHVMVDHPNMLRIPEPVTHIEVGYFCLTQEECEKERPFVIVPKGFEAGIQYCKQNFEHCLSVYNDQNAFKALTRETGDVLVGSFLSVVSVICNIDFTDTIYYRPIPELSLPVYHYIQKKHIELLPVLNERVVEMHRTGEMDKLFDDYWAKMDQCEVIPIRLGDRFIESLEN